MNNWIQKYSQALLYLGVFLTGLAFWRWPTFDPDLGWHLLGGAWMIEHGRVPYYDFINSFGGVWHDYHWLAQLVWYAVYHWLDYEGLRLLLGLIMALLAKAWLDIFFLAAPKLRNYPAVTGLLIFLSLYLIGDIVSIRPQMLSFLFLAWVLRRLLQAPTRWELPFLFLITVLLVNIHVNWIFVPILWLLFRTIPRYFKVDLYNCSALYLWGGFAFISASGLISPYGILPGTGVEHYPWLNYVLLLDYLDMPAELTAYILEMRPFFSGTGATYVLVMLLLMIVAKGMRFVDLKTFPHYWISGIFGFALLADKVKMLGIFMTLGLPLFAVTVQQAWEMGHIWAEKFPKLRVFAPKLTLAVLLLIVCFSGTRAVMQSPLVYDNTYFLPQALPMEACTKLTQLNLTHRPGRDHIRLLTHFNYGGWCRWVVYQNNPGLDLRVTTDGRTQYRGSDNVILQRDLYSITNYWEKTLNKWAPDVILARNDESLAHFLVRMPNWKMLYQDRSFCLFEPVAIGSGGPSGSRTHE